MPQASPDLTLASLPHSYLTTTAELEQRFWSRVERSADGCWTWTRKRNNRGYGLFYVASQARLQYFSTAHRLAYWLTNGPIPKGMHVCHACDNPPCVRPSHLWLGTMSDNLADMVSKGRYGKRNLPRGENHPMAKLSNADVAEIRKRFQAGERPYIIARDYPVTLTHICRLTKPEVAGKVPRRHEMPPFPGPFGLKGGF